MKKVIVLIVAIVLSVSTSMAKDGKNEGYYKDFIKFLKVSGTIDTQKVMLKNMFDQFKKMVKSQPLIVKESFQIGSKWGKSVAKRVFEKMKK